MIKKVYRIVCRNSAVSVKVTRLIYRIELITEEYVVKNVYRIVSGNTLFSVNVAYGVAICTAYGTYAVNNDVLRLLCLLLAYRALLPMTFFVDNPFIVVSYLTDIFTSITSRIASVVKAMLCNISLVTANGTLVPMVCSIVCPFVAIVMGYLTDIFASIASCITSVIEFVS